MTKERAAYLKETDPSYFERTGAISGEKILRERGKAWFSELGKMSAAKRFAEKGRLEGHCTLCKAPSRRFPNRIECTQCSWKIYSF